MRVLVCLPPARTSNELDLLAAMPDTSLTVVSGPSGPRPKSHGHSFVLPARRVPFVGGHEGRTAAPAWLAGMRRLDPGQVDVVASLELFSFGSFQAARLARRLHVPHAVLIFENLRDSPLYRLPPWREITRRVVRTGDLFVCFSEHARRHALDVGCAPGRCVVVHPGVDTEAFSPRAEGRMVEPIVIFVGMLRSDRGADKGVVEIVEACRRLAAEVAGLKLVVVGDGPLRPELARLAARERFIEVLGGRARTDIASLLRSARVFVLAPKRTPKWAEQFGFALVEAMASGLPVVSTRSGVVPEVVPGWNPLVAEGDVDSLADGIRAALSSAGDDWGRRNRADALARFDVRRQGGALRDALATVVG